MPSLYKKEIRRRWDQSRRFCGDTYFERFEPFDENSKVIAYESGYIESSKAHYLQ